LLVQGYRRERLIVMHPSDPGELGTSRFFSARFQAHSVFGLAGRARIILHAGVLLLAAYFAA